MLTQPHMYRNLLSAMHSTCGQSMLQCSHCKHSSTRLWTCRQLLNWTPDNQQYHQGLQQALDLVPAASQPLSSGQYTELQSLYAELQQLFPRSNAVRRIPLDFLVRPVHSHPAAALS